MDRKEIERALVDFKADSYPADRIVDFAVEIVNRALAAKDVEIERLNQERLFVQKQTAEKDAEIKWLRSFYTNHLTPGLEKP